MTYPTCQFINRFTSHKFLLECMRGSHWNVCEAATGMYARQPLECMRGSHWNVYEAATGMYARQPLECMRGSHWNVCEAATGMYARQPLECIRGSHWNVCEAATGMLAPAMASALATHVVATVRSPRGDQIIIS